MEPDRNGSEVTHNLIYQVAVGDQNALYEECIASVAAYCVAHDIHHVVQRDPVLRISPRDSQRSVNALRLGYLPIYEKENALDYLDRYQAVCVIDSDVYIMPGAPNIFDAIESAAFYGVIERDMPVTDQYRRKLRKYSQAQYQLLRTEADFDWNSDGAAFFNMGIMLMTQHIRQYMAADSARDFLQRHDFERFVNGQGAWRWSTDQTLLNYWIRRDGVPWQALDWRWNALYGAILPGHIHEAWFVHFFLAQHNVGDRSVGDIIKEIMCKPE